MSEPNGPYQPGPYPNPAPGQPQHWQQQPAPPHPPAGARAPGPYPPHAQPPGTPDAFAPRGGRAGTRRRVFTALCAGLPVLGAAGYFASRIAASGANPVSAGSGGYNPGDYDPSTLPSAAGAANGITVSAVQAMLTKANRALASGDQNAYTALFTGPAAAQAATLFKNLRKFQFSFAEYQLIGNSTRQFDTGDAATVGMDVAFAHQLKGIDPGRVAEWYRWTITKDGSGNPVVTGLGGSPTVNASAKYVYYPHPWDSSHDIIVHYQGGAILCAETQADAAVMMRFANEAASAVANNLDDWQAGAGTLDGVSRGVLYMHTTSDKLYTWYSGKANQAGYEAGLTTPMISASYLADPESQPMSYSGARVALNLATYEANQGEDSPYTLYRHEGFHAMVFPLLSAVQSSIPLWVVEGGADFFATRSYPNPVTGYMRVPQIQQYARSGWSGNFPTNGEVYSTTELVGDASYGLATMVYYYVASRYGLGAACKLLTANYESASPDGIGQGSDNVAAAIQSALGISQDQLQTGWRQFLTTQLGVRA